MFGRNRKLWYTMAPKLHHSLHESIKATTFACSVTLFLSPTMNLYHCVCSVITADNFTPATHDESILGDVH